MKGVKRFLLVFLAGVIAWVILLMVQPKAEQPVCPNCGAELVDRNGRLECVQTHCGYSNK